MLNEKLAIAIPTYNRHLVLKENIMVMLPELKKNSINIYISDDSENDLTRDMISELKTQYNNIQYHKNKPSLGHDKNCLKTLEVPQAEYIWYLGDSQIISNQGIREILNIIERKDYDLIIVNSSNRVTEIDSKHYLNPNDFFLDLAWHATLTGSTIYRKDILFRKNYTKYVGSNFIQLGIILEELLESTNGLYWINKNLIDVNKNKGNSYWDKETFEVFAKDWVNFINNLPNDYLYKNKVNVIQSHSNHTGIFKFKNYIVLRKKKILNLKSYFKFYNKLKFATSLNIYTVLIIALLPEFILSKVGKIRESSKRRQDK